MTEEDNAKAGGHVDPANAFTEALQKSLSEALNGLNFLGSAPRHQEIADRVSRAVSVAFEQTTSGPLPSPGILRGYKEVVPGLAKQIAGMALSEQMHRHMWERYALWNDIFAQSGGLFLGWMLAAGCAVGAFFLAASGNNIGASILLSVVVAAIVRTFTRFDRSGGRNAAGRRSRFVARRSASVKEPEVDSSLRPPEHAQITRKT